MYKATQNNADFMDRAADHSTKGSRRGFCEVGQIDSKLLYDENVRGQMQRQMKGLIEERHDLEKILAPDGANIKKWRGNIVRRFKGNEHLFKGDRATLKYYFDLGDLLNTINNQYQNMERKPKSFASLFIEIAEKDLTAEQFNSIKRKALELL